MNTQIHVGPSASRCSRWLAVTIALAAGLLLAGISGDAAHAKSINGTKKADRLIGTKGSDRIGGKAGNDRIVGKAGADKLKGGGGRDRINGGDSTRDKRISGGPGKDVCRIDAVDKPIVRGCEKIKVVGAPGGGSGGGGSGGSGGGSDRGDLKVSLSQGTTCAAGAVLPPCLFLLTGTGADTLIGTVSGGGGVTVAVGAGVSVIGENWTATGAYSCTGNGFIRVEIGPEAVDVPITCTA